MPSFDSFFHRSCHSRKGCPWNGCHLKHCCVGNQPYRVMCRSTLVFWVFISKPLGNLSLLSWLSMNERGGRCSILTRRWSRASYNVTDARIFSQLWVSRLRADHQALSLVSKISAHASFCNSHGWLNEEVLLHSSPRAKKAENRRPNDSEWYSTSSPDHGLAVGNLGLACKLATKSYLLTVMSSNSA